MWYEISTCQMQYGVANKKTDQEDACALEGTDLENVESIKYLGVTITSDLRWNTHVSNVGTKANRTLEILRRNLYSWPREVKDAAYKGLVHPVLNYCKIVQEHAARFVTGTYSHETGKTTGILGQLKWESLKKRRKDNRLNCYIKALKIKPVYQQRT